MYVLSLPTLLLVRSVQTPVHKPKAQHRRAR